MQPKKVDPTGVLMLFNSIAMALIDKKVTPQEAIQVVTMVFVALGIDPGMANKLFTAKFNVKGDLILTLKKAMLDQLTRL
jgi:hypothetical protein